MGLLTVTVVCLMCLVAQIEGCSTPLGMESGEIKDSQITASHWLYKSAHYQAKNARLNSDSPGGAWCSEGIHEESDQYIEIDLLKNTKVTGIATQGRKMLTEYVESFQILYRRDGDEEQYKQYNVSGSWKEFPANRDTSTIVRNNFARPIIARTIRIFPRGEEFAIYCMRLELYGCKWTHELSALQTYSAPMGNEKDGVDLRDTTYDGNTRLPSNQILENGLGKLTDDLYGTKDSLLSTNSGGLTGASPWVGYNTANPELTFHFRVPKIIKQVMVHVNNDNSNGKGIKVFRHMDVSISSDGVKYTPVKRYTTIAKQREKKDAYPVVCNLGEVVTKHLRMTFTKDGDWLLISEVVFMTDTYPPRPVIPDGGGSTDNTKDNNNNNNGNNNQGGGSVFTFPPITSLPPGVDDTTTGKKDSKGLSFPIILTIALVTMVLAIIVGIIIYKSYRKNRKHDSHNPNHHDMSSSSSTGSSPHPPGAQSNHLKQDSLALLGAADERYVAAYHQQQQMKAPQQTTLLPQNGLYFQQPVPIHHPGGGGYNQNVMMS